MEVACFVKFFSSVLLMQTLMTWFAVAITNINTDQAALLALKSHISGNAFASNNWSTTASVCSWIGVTCGAQHHRVITLDLSDMGIHGTIPSEIGNLSFLAFLSVRNNNFYSFLPNELAQLLRLKHLDVGFNFFNGSIPPSLGSLPRLENLLLEANSFIGDFPLSLCNISLLQRVNASQNQLSGFMHSSFISSCSLEILDLSFNNLSAGLSNDIFSHFPKLQGLYLARSLLSGSIPVSIGNCTLIKEIDFSENTLTGQIKAISAFIIVHNTYTVARWLSGTIPAEIGELLANLEILRIHDNDLSGSIPPALFNISTLKAVVMSANCLTGNLPSTMGLFLPNLVDLRLASNKLEGTFPSSISNASMLTFIELSNNSFTGSISATLGNLRHLQLLMLDKNNLFSESSTPDSSFLSSLTNCKQLRRIDLSGVSLNASLPKSIGNLSASLEQFWADNCDMMGNIPREIGNWTSLMALSLSNNQLTGTIPTTIARLRKLERLHLQGNKLKGNIKYDLCRMDRLFDLSLGGNLLSGSIPGCLGNLTLLAYLNLSSNNLTSSIPPFLFRLVNILLINMSSNCLSGSLPTVSLPVVEEIDLSKNLLSGEIPPSIMGFASITYLSLAKNGLRGLIPSFLPLTLEFLDLSGNNLSGQIPKKLEELRYLRYFDVSFNELEGEIPSGGPFVNFSAQSYVKNYALCGPPRLHVPPCPDFHQRLKRDKHNLRILLILVPLIFIFLWLWLRSRKSSVSLIAPTITQEVKRFSYAELKQATDGFSGANLLGTGRFGSAYKGTLQDGTVVAIKVFKMDEVSLRSFNVENEVMRWTGHRNLIRLRSSCGFGKFKALVMEYMVNGSLDKWLYTHNYHLDMLQRLDIMIEAASAVKYLHCDCSRPTVHCDLKPSNILLDEDMIARVCDFSISIFLYPGQQDPVRRSSFMCTIGYVAPEYGLYGIVSTKTDVFSFGIMLMETFTGKRPTDEMFGGEMNLRRWVVESLPHEVNKVVDPSLLQTEEQFIAKMACLSGLMRLAQGCTAESPIERYDMKQVVTILQKIKEVYLRNIYGD